MGSNPKLRSSGSAVAVSQNMLATNCHVVRYNTIRVKMGRILKPGKIVYRYKTRDICLLTVANAYFKPVTVRQTSTVNIGEEVFAIGNPEGLEKSISKGIISNKHRYRGSYLLQTDVVISPGSSGGGLFDHKARLIGITTAVHKRNKDIVFAIPTEWVSQALFARKQKNLPVIAPIQAGRTTLKNIGMYGKNNIGLYRQNGKCFISVPGMDDKGQLNSLALWVPEYPRVLILFPRISLLTSALRVVKSELNQPKTALKAMPSKSYIFFNHQMYELMGYRKVKGKYDLLVTTFPNNPTRTFKGEGKIVAQYKNNKLDAGYTTVNYNLRGFDDAWSAYDRHCK